MNIQEVLLKEHREQEDNRRLAVDYAVNDLLARDTQYRNELDKQLQEKMKRAEKNKKQNENKKSLMILEARRYNQILFDFYVSLPFTDRKPLTMRGE